MDEQIPCIAEALYNHFVMPPDPRFWPDRLSGKPVLGHGLYAFYQGLRLGVRLTGACLEKVTA